MGVISCSFFGIFKETTHMKYPVLITNTIHPDSGYGSPMHRPSKIFTRSGSNLPPSQDRMCDVNCSHQQWSTKFD